MSEPPLPEPPPPEPPLPEPPLPEPPLPEPPLPDRVPAGPRPPWWAVCHDRVPGEPAAGRPVDGLVVRVLAGRRMATAGGVLAEFARAWEFPDYFGHNWSALEDCLSDLAWRPARGYLCRVTDADHVLQDGDPAVLGLLLDLLDRVGRRWATPIALAEPWDRPAVPFHTVLACAGEPQRRRLAARIAQARAASGH